MNTLKKLQTLCDDLHNSFTDPRQQQVINLSFKDFVEVQEDLKQAGNSTFEIINGAPMGGGTAQPTTEDIIKIFAGGYDFIFIKSEKTSEIWEALKEENPSKGEVLNESHKYPSRYKIPQSVDLDFDGTRISGCITEAVRFTEDKVRYDILIPVRSEEEILYTKIENVDSVFVVDPI